MFTTRDLTWMFGRGLNGMTVKEAKAKAQTIRGIIIGSYWECKTIFDVYIFRNHFDLPLPGADLRDLFLRWDRFSDPDADEWVVVEKQDGVAKHAIFVNGIRKTPWTTLDEDPREA